MPAILRAIVLALATIGSSWAAYEAARWGGEQARQFARASAQRAESVRASNRAFQLAQVDVTSFAVWALAAGEGNARSASFLRARFRGEFALAFEAWLKSDPSGVIPPGTPFQRPEYRNAALAEASGLLTEAQTAAVAAQRANQVADNFIFSVVLFSSVNFLAGIQPQSDQARPWTRRFMTALTCALLLFAAAFMLRLPPNVGF
jgi:hypothetical protein